MQSSNNYIKKEKKDEIQKGTNEMKKIKTPHAPILSNITLSCDEDEEHIQLLQTSQNEKLSVLLQQETEMMEWKTQVTRQKKEMQTLEDTIDRLKRDKIRLEVYN